jgi:hypothetical protein
MVQERPVLSPQQDCDGRTIGHIATFLRRTEAEVREKATELGLKLPQAATGE